MHDMLSGSLENKLFSFFIDFQVSEKPLPFKFDTQVLAL